VASVWGLLSAPLLAALERTSALTHGEPWRGVTSLLVQDGGVAGTVSNLGFLLAVGVAAEQVLRRPSLVGLYLGAALAGQAAGVFWQPVGAGNSIAICGLAGGLAWALPRAPRWAGSALALWLGALLATAWIPLIGVGIVGAAVDQRVAAAPGRRRTAFVVATAVVAAALVAVGNIHGAALGIGILLGAAPGLRRSGPADRS
jgi:membrane associated rhomboid family serine protease